MIAHDSTLAAICNHHKRFLAHYERGYCGRLSQGNAQNERLPPLRAPMAYATHMPCWVDNFDGP